MAGGFPGESLRGCEGIIRGKGGHRGVSRGDMARLDGSRGGLWHNAPMGTGIQVFSRLRLGWTAAKNYVKLRPR